MEQFHPRQFDDAKEANNIAAVVEDHSEAAEVDAGVRNHNAIFETPIHKMAERILEIAAEEDSEDDDEDNSDFDYDDLELYNGGKAGPNSQKHMQVYDAVNDLSAKFAGRISLDNYDTSGLQPEAANKLISLNKKSTANRIKVKDKQDRATVEQVIDPRTRMILYKLLSSEKLLSIDGCISTGKEANVYHATGTGDSSFAIKIYKTSILTFKARDKYVSGEFRFRSGYCKKNPRKMVRLWAEKEYRNLLRIHSSGKILVPQPRLLKSHVLVMDFIGDNGWPSPLLKDVKFDKMETTDHQVSTNGEMHDNLTRLLSKLYRDALNILYHMYKNCRLVHADFSEFNLILKDNIDLYVIDVSQSVEHDHPRSFDFLRSDIKNIQDFFGKRGVMIGNFKEIFDWITSPTIDDLNMNSKLDSILNEGKAFEESINVAEEVFRQSFIPRKMNEVGDYERDVEKARSGKENLIYTTLLGMKSDMSGPQATNNGKSATLNPDDNCEVINSSSSEDEDAGDSSNECEENETKFRHSGRRKSETNEEKKERKKAVKEIKSEKRQTKVKKHVKKRKEKLTHANSKR